MAGIFSFFSSASNNSGKYEKELEELEEKIKQKELALSEMKLNKSSPVTFYLYSISIYMVYVLIYFLLLRNPQYDQWDSSIIKASPLVGFPIITYFYRSTTNYYYEKRISSETEQLSALKTKLRITIEELKKNSSYYKTKSILERYELEEKGSKSVKQNSNKMIPAQSQSLRQRAPPKLANNNIQRSTTIASNGIPLKPRNSQASNIQVEGGQPWLGKLMDAIVGEEENSNDATKFALVCINCFAHNGLVSANDYNIIQYTCPKCNTFNPSRRSQRRKSVENLGPTEEQQQELMARSLTGAPKPPAPRPRKLLPEEFRKTGDGSHLPKAAEELKKE